MNVRRLLDLKPIAEVETISERETLSEVAKRLSMRKIGALVVTGADGGVSGIISERDVVRQLSARGAGCLASAVRETMTRTVVAASPKDSADDVLAKMTAGRFRHMPVIENDQLIGILSIGDVVKTKMEEITAENEAMESMIRGF